MTLKRGLIAGALTALALAFFATFVVAIWNEAPGTNSYALLADGWLQGRLHAFDCFDGDCALFDGKTYIIFPPLPAVLALPFVALFGPNFHAFLPLSVVMFAASGWLWWRIFQQQAANRDIAMLLMLTALFATPLAFVTLRGDHVWFFAQSTSFFMTAAALYFALAQPNRLLVGFFIALAFLSRQMTILYLPFLYVLMLDRDTPWWHINGAAIKRVLAMAAFPLAAIGIYLAYNYARFGAPLETGYAFLFPPQFDAPDGVNFIINRVREIGLFSDQYLLFNAIYMFLAGPHVEFTGPYLTEMARFDNNGASVFLVTPVLLFALLARWDRAFWFAMMTVGTIMGITLFYHSNGFSQFSAQRYALDWLPILLIFVARGITAEQAPALAILTAYAMTVTLAMIGLGGMIGG